jgi:3-deoxy-manno-octulosonate cytidylyltransferase (CMP-KDO synthetase)
MNVIGIIPARMGSTRFPGKPLEKIHGMPMIGHCYHRTAIALGPDATYVATCDSEIAEYIKSIGGNVIMTSDTHTRATTRTAEAMEKIEKQIGRNIDVVVMMQGDEPLIQPKTVVEAISYFETAAINIVNIMSHIKTQEAFKDKNNVKVVVDCNNDALYFSREPIPSNWNGWEGNPRYMQTGVIAFRRKTLLQFNSMKETMLEQVESVDMNRILEMGGKIRMVLTGMVTIGVDVPDELKAAEQELSNDSTMLKYF